VVTCQIGTIPGLGTVTVTIRGQVTSANGTTLNNTASVSGTKSARARPASISWTAVSGKRNAGEVRFEPLGPNRSKVHVRMEYEPDGVLESVGGALGLGTAWP